MNYDGLAHWRAEMEKYRADLEAVKLQLDGARPMFEPGQTLDQKHSVYRGKAINIAARGGAPVSQDPKPICGKAL